MFFGFALLCCRDKAPEQTTNDTSYAKLHYDEKDYDKMRAMLLGDSEVMSALKQLVAEGNEDGKILEKMLHTPYRDRLLIGLSERDLDEIMLSYFASKKFDSLEVVLQSDSMQMNRRALDSLMMELEFSKKDADGLVK